MQMMEFLVFAFQSLVQEIQTRLYKQKQEHLTGYLMLWICQIRIQIL